MKVGDYLRFLCDNIYISQRCPRSKLCRIGDEFSRFSRVQKSSSAVRAAEPLIPAARPARRPFTFSRSGPLPCSATGVVATGVATIFARPNRKGPSVRRPRTPSACGWRCACRGGLLRIRCDSEPINPTIKKAQRVQVARLVSANAADRNAYCRQKLALPFVLSLQSQ